jgi:hypothetical protein
MTKREADARRFTAHVQALEAQLGQPLHEIREDREQARRIARDALRDPAIKRFVTRPAPREMVDRVVALDPRVRGTTAAERRFNKLLHRLGVPFRKHAGEPKFFTAGSRYELNPLYARLAETLPPHIVVTGISAAATIRERADRAHLKEEALHATSDTSVPPFTLTCLEGGSHASVVLTLFPDPRRRPLFVYLDAYTPPDGRADRKWLKERLEPLARGTYHFSPAAGEHVYGRLAAVEGLRPPPRARLVVDVERHEAYVVGTEDLASVACNAKLFDRVYVLHEAFDVRVTHHVPVIVWGRLQDRHDLTDQACTVYAHSYIVALAQRLQDRSFADRLLATAHDVIANPTTAPDLARHVEAALVEGLPQYYTRDGAVRPGRDVRRFNNQERWRLGSEIISLLAP